MINVQQITSQLARLPDQALQQYAQMHKNDPYILSLALSESNRRKQMREGAQTNAPEQPKVVDQAIQSMAAPMPEDIGIAQLPAGDMEFADGGIVAFDEGGPVERYQSGGQLRSAFSTFLKNTGQVSAYANGTPAQKAAIEAAFRTAVQGPFVPPAGAAPGAAPAAAAPAGAAPAASNPEGWYRRFLGGKPLPRVLSGGIAFDIAGLPLLGAAALVDQMQEMRDQGYTADPRGEFDLGEGTAAQLTFDEDRRRRAISAMSREDRLRKFGTADVNLAMAGGASSPAGREAAATAPPTAAPAGAAPATASGAPAAAAPNAGAGGPRQNTAGRRNLGAGTPPAAAAAAVVPAAPATLAAAAPVAPTAGLPSLDVSEMTKKALETAAAQPNPFAKDVEALGRERVKAKEEEAAGVEAIQKRFDDIFKGRRERLDTREAELGKMEDQGIGLALLQAGATMMSTPGGLGVALGESIKVGTKQYASGLERLRSAQEKLSDARDRLEEAEAQRGELSARELLKVRSDVKNAGISAREDMIKSNMQMYGVNREVAMKMVDNQIKVGVAQLEVQNRKDIAQYEAQNRRDISQFEQTEATKRTGMTTDATLRAARIAAAQRGETAEGRTMASIVSEYAKNPTKLKILEQTDPALAQIIRAQLQLLTVPAAQSAPGAGGARP